MGRKEEKAGEKGSGEEEEEEDEDEEGVTTSTASAFGLHHFRRLSAGGPVPPQTCLRRNCNKLGDGNGVIGAATAGNAVPTASGAVRAAGKEFSNEGTIVSERGMYPVVHILEGLFVLLLVILFDVFVDIVMVMMIIFLFFLLFAIFLYCIVTCIITLLVS